jgi:hypothetical protein
VRRLLETGDAIFNQGGGAIGTVTGGHGRRAERHALAGGLGRSAVLVWTGTKDGVMNVYSAVSDDRGATFNVRRRVNDRVGDASANVEQPPRVALSASSITVVWSAKEGGFSVIRMARSVDGGKTFSPATAIHERSLTGARGWASIAAGPNGNVHVVWLDGRYAKPMDHSKAAPITLSTTPASAAHTPMRQDAMTAAIDGAGAVTEVPIAANTCFCCETAVAVGGRGQVFAAWRHIFPGSMRDIAMAVSADDGKTFGPLARVSEDRWEMAGCPEDGPSLAVDAGGAAYILWPTVVSDALPQKAVFYASTTDGRSFTSRVRLSRTDQDEAAHPQIAAGSCSGPSGQETAGVRRGRSIRRVRRLIRWSCRWPTAFSWGGPVERDPHPSSRSNRWQ